MTEDFEDRIKYTQSALRLVGIHYDQYAIELIVGTVDAVKEKGGDFSIKDSAVVESICIDREEARQNARKQSTEQNNQPPTKE